MQGKLEMKKIRSRLIHLRIRILQKFFDWWIDISVVDSSRKFAFVSLKNKGMGREKLDLIARFKK
jgi:hypothetical protein